MRWLAIVVIAFTCLDCSSQYALRSPDSGFNVERVFNAEPSVRSVHHNSPRIAPTYQPGQAIEPQQGFQTISRTSVSSASSTQVPASPTANPDQLSSTSGTSGNPGVNCSNLYSGRDNKCWKELNLTLWVQDWIDLNQCQPGEGFAACFMREEGFFGQDCTGIKIGTCIPPTGKDLANKPEVFYVAYNIFAINQFFLSWWTSVGNALALASNNVDDIVQILDPPDNHNLVMDEIFISMTAMFAVALPGPLAYALEETWKLSTGLIAVATMFEGAVLAAPQVSRFLFPADTQASQVIQMADLKSKLASVIGNVQHSLNQTLGSVMQDPKEFLAFAEQGNFTAVGVALPDQTDVLLYAFNTYVISQALNGNNIYGVAAPDTDPKALATNGTKTAYKIDCKSYNEQNVCDAWWWSNATKTAFGLNNFSHMNYNYGKQLTKLLTKYTTGRMLFEDALSCGSTGSFDAPINVTVGVSGINVKCISQMKVYTWDMQCLPWQHNNCEFVEAPRQNTFGFNPMRRHDVSVSAVPYCYLGPGIRAPPGTLLRS